MRKLLSILTLIVAVGLFCFQPVADMEQEVNQAHTRAKTVLTENTVSDPEFPPPPAMPTTGNPLEFMIEPTTGRPWSEILSRTQGPYTEESR